ncbi:hypothetical protein MMC17_004967 [Xylographa soralifera]|nr:hypothetical protein [Xylographa soralifera]
MTGRGNLKFFHPSSNPTVTIGLTLDTSPLILRPTSPCPFFVTVSARILTSPHPASPITLCTLLNPLGNLHNRCFGNIMRVSPSTEPPKRIEIWPSYWSHHHWNPADLRDNLPFVTLRPDELYEVKFEIEPERTAAADLVVGEKYRVRLTDMGLGTKWWAFGALEDDLEIRYMEWDYEEIAEGEEGEGRDGDREFKKRRYTRGEDPESLALVVEKGEAIFEIG